MCVKFIQLSLFSSNPMSNLFNYSFRINTDKSFGDMAEEMKEFPQLSATPPLQVEDIGLGDLHLVLLSEGTAKTGIPDIYKSDDEFIEVRLTRKTGCYTCRRMLLDI